MTRGARLAIVMVGVACWPANAGDDRGSPKTLAARGRYLVESVAMCQNCHTPRNARGAVLADRWLGGAPTDTRCGDSLLWSEMAPPIAGLPGTSHGQAVLFLMNGQRLNGTYARPPMPEYRLKRNEAEAIVVYLESLTPPD